MPNQTRIGAHAADFAVKCYFRIFPGQLAAPAIKRKMFEKNEKEKSALCYRVDKRMENFSAAFLPRS
jgi:hypothetical protein